MTSSPFKIVMAQMDNCVGAIEQNTKLMIELTNRARKQGAQLIVFPELSMPGYPPEDLLFRPGFQRRTEQQLALLAEAADGIAIVCGHTRRTQEGIYNSASWFVDKQCVATYDKQKLPNYGVFDEKRYFKSGHESCLVDFAGLKIATLICEDIWQEGPVEKLKSEQVDLLVVLNASPFRHDKPLERTEVIRRAAASLAAPVLYVHSVGGQDDLVFDGGSIAMNADGQVAVQLPFFKTDYRLLELNQGEIIKQPLPAELSREAVIYQALVTGTRDYVLKNKFPGVILGLSGGIDSALTLAVAVDAVGADQVTAVAMPSRYSADISFLDAKAQAEQLGVAFECLSIEPCFKTFLEVLAQPFADYPHDLTEQNIQARIRGTLLMALSNKFGQLVLATGNKSEYAVGYSTLYGDMCGGYAPLKDVFKTDVYKLANYRNTISPAIPERVITRAPSAELAPDQKDEDSLPPYAILDQIVALYLEKDFGIPEIVEQGFAEETVRDILRRIDANEYKRRQSAPGVRISSRAFGRDRRYPITSEYGAVRV